MADRFEAMLTGGHPNSLGRTVDVVDAVLADRTRLAELYACYFSEDEIVRFAGWLAPHLERLAHDRRKSVARRATKLLALSD